MITCKFKLRPEFTCLPPKSKKPKMRSGKYHGSYFWSIPAFGRNSWVVVGTIEGDFEEGLEQGPVLEKALEGCLEFLNQPLKMRRKSKKNPNPKPIYEFGFLRPYWTEIKKDPKTQKISLLVHLITDDPKNKNFWGEGQEVVSGAIRSRQRG